MRFGLSLALLALVSLSTTGASACGSMPSADYPLQRDLKDCSVLIAGPNAINTNARADAYYQRGTLYHLSGQLDLAIADYSKAISWNKNLADAFEARGDAYADTGDRAKAEADYAEAANQRGHGPSISADVCWIRAVRGHPLDRALEDCNGALKDDPDNTDALGYRSFVYYRMGSHALAIADCDAVLKKRARDPDALYVRGLAKLRSGDAVGGNSDVAAAKDADYRIAETYAMYGVKP